MKKHFNFAAISLILISIVFTGCSDESGNNDGNTDSNTSVAFVSVTQIGGTSGIADSTALELTFDVDPANLSADNITITGATKGALTDSGTTRTLTISDITVGDEGTVTVAITNPTNYIISNSVQTAIVYDDTYFIGAAYGGGKIAYILRSSDPGYDVNVCHGLIAALEDQSSLITWSISAYWSTALPDGTETALGTGAANTDTIIAQNGAGSSYAAGLARTCGDDGYTDWYLPSFDELNMMYSNRVAIGNFIAGSYWSSSESSNNSALCVNFVNGTQYICNKSYAERLRAVRAF